MTYKTLFLKENCQRVDLRTILWFLINYGNTGDTTKTKRVNYASDCESNTILANKTSRKYYLSTVKKAAKLAVKVANIKTTKSQYAATRTLPDRDLGASPPPWGVNEVRANQKLSLSVKMRVGYGWASLLFRAEYGENLCGEIFFVKWTYNRNLFTKKVQCASRYLSKNHSINAVTTRAAKIANQTSTRNTSMNLNKDLGLTGSRIMMEIPDWSKYGATKSTTSSLSLVMVIPATAMSISPLTRSPMTPDQVPSGFLLPYPSL